MPLESFTFVYDILVHSDFFTDGNLTVNCYYGQDGLVT
jgi:hypothetical protein